MGLLYRKHLSKDAFARVTLAWGKRTNEFLEQLAMKYRLLKGQALSFILEEFLGKPELREEFMKYSVDFKKVDDDNLEFEYIEREGKKVPKIHHTNFEIPSNVVDEINKMMFDLRYVDRTSFIRAIIHFFYDKNFSEELVKKAEELKIKMSELGYKVLSVGVIDSELFARLSI